MYPSHGRCIVQNRQTDKTDSANGGGNGKYLSEVAAAAAADIARALAAQLVADTTYSYMSNSTTSF